MTSPTETTTNPTYRWATALGAVTGGMGVVLLTACITLSAGGHAEIPSGVPGLASVLTLGGLVLTLFRILHSDREQWEQRMERRLEAVDRKLNNVWGITARTSLEAVPSRAAQSRGERGSRQRGRRAARRHEQTGDADAEGGPGAVVRHLRPGPAGDVGRLPSPDVLAQARDLARKVIGLERRRSEDNPEDRN